MKIAFDGATERQSARVLVLMSELGSSKLFSRLWWRVPGILHGEKSRTRNALNVAGAGLERVSANSGLPDSKLAHKRSCMQVISTYDVLADRPAPS